MIAHVLPFAQCGGAGELLDPVLNFLDADQFIGAPQQTAWAADNSLIAFSAAAATFTFRPDGGNLKQAAACESPELGTLIGATNAGYRNQVVARLADGTEKPLTSSPTFKYHIAISPDGTAVTFTAITMSDYNAAIGAYNPTTGTWKAYTGYTTDVYIVRITGGAEQKVSTSGGGHHPSWQRDIPVKIPARPTPIPTVAPTVPPATPQRTPTSRP